MLTMSFDSNFDPKRLIREAEQAAARQLEQRCKTAAAPYGGVHVTIERNADGAPRKILLNGSASSVEAAKGVLA